MVAEVSDNLLREDSDMRTFTEYAPLSPVSLGDWAINNTQSFCNYFSVAVSSLSHSIHRRGQTPSTWSTGGLLCQPPWQKFSGSAGGLSLGLKHMNDRLWWQLCLADWHTVFARKETEPVWKDVSEDSTINSSVLQDPTWRVFCKRVSLLVYTCMTESKS